MKRREFAKIGLATAGATLPLQSLLARRAFGQVGQAAPLPGNQIPQFVDPLPLLGAPTTQGGTMEVMVNDPAVENTIYMREFNAHILPTGLLAPGIAPATRVWGYRLGAAPALADTYIGPVVVADRAFPVAGDATTQKPTRIRWVNALGGTANSNVTAWLQSTDLSLHWADPNGDGMQMGSLAHYVGRIPVVPHLHGGEVPPQLDGGPDAWWTDVSQKGHAYYSGAGAAAAEAIYQYPNTQEAANIWFHDHALGITRLNVYAGLAGGYILYDSVNPPPGDLGGLAGAAKIIPLVIQDRMFDVTGQLFFPNVGLNPEHRYWVPEFVGDVICVNGRAWPYLTVDQKRYRFFFLDGSNARFYDMFLIDPVSGVKGPPMYVIGTDGGYLNNPVLIDPNATGRQTKAGTAKSLVMGPGERYDVLIDFGDATWLAQISAAYAAMGMPVPDPLRLQLRNNAKTPFPGGAPAPNSITGRVMEFRVSTTAGVTLPSVNYNPATTPNLRPSAPIVPLTAATPQVTRQLTLNEVMGPGGPLEILVNNTKWDGHSARTYGDFFPDVDSNTYYSELPKEGETELWEIINLTADAHPIHLHLVQFQLVNRQTFDVGGYAAAYNAAFPGIAGDPVGGMFIPTFGPPLDYNALNGDGAVGGNPAAGPLQQEVGWKDTVIMYPGQVTRIMVRWAPTDVAAGTNGNFPFDPNGGHGYVWHCHIIDHEDNEMMRPDLVVPKGGTVGSVTNAGPAPTRTVVKDTDY